MTPLELFKEALKQLEAHPDWCQGWKTPDDKREYGYAPAGLCNLLFKIVAPEEYIKDEVDEEFNEKWEQVSCIVAAHLKQYYTRYGSAFGFTNREERIEALTKTIADLEQRAEAEEYAASYSD